MFHGGLQIGTTRSWKDWNPGCGLQGNQVGTAAVAQAIYL
jgi:hypothetical protein